MSIKRSIFNKRKILIPLLILAFAIPIVTADVIYYYSGVINVTTTSSPIGISTGPNGVVKLPSGTGYYIDVSAPKGTNSFTAYINITNSSYAYFYEAVTLNAYQALNLYITNISIAQSSTYINNMWIVIGSSTNPSEYSIQIISGGKPTTPSTPITLTTGTYYVSFLVQPTTPLPAPSTTSIATVTVYFGDNVATSSNIPLPPT
ncbi:hypothetical protein DFR86_10635 [Acidianus sulfidivorans JP7]|uniref:Uncharacterized protein n=1 Tax=Acidianus sulfidivorans JP7 TaxID=619593 RepID=A0A2U9IPK9_9CREN|nr:hypothetical protein [Acidianus sulfidivorans]AWR97945.1 hypothetical protein DFR86_10635 [Acidianus sulfidivorans JP7]